MTSALQQYRAIRQRLEEEKKKNELPTTYIQLVLEDNDKISHNVFLSSDELEDFLESIDLYTYIYTNIIVCIDDELNWEMTKIYKKRYLNK
jgi:hypothetical protein